MQPEGRAFDNSDLIMQHVRHLEIGLWVAQFTEEGPEFYADDITYALLGLDRSLSPGALYKEWFDRIEDSCKAEVAAPLERMKDGLAEVQYIWHHPDGRTMFLRTGGCVSKTNTRRAECYMQDITRYNHLEFERERRRETIAIEEAAAKNAQDSEHVLGAFIDLYDTLTRAKDCSDEMLAVVAKFYQADRAYVFQISMDGTWIDNTLEWCAEGVTPEIANLQKIPIEGVQAWVEAYEQVGAFYISMLDEDIDHDSLTYKVLEPQGIDSLITAPIYEEGELIGFVGVDNPRANTGNLLMLKAFAQLSSGDILRRVRDDQKTLMVALEEAEKANRAKSSFLFNMSHDIRTPMNAIIGFTDIAEKYIDDKDRVLESLEKVRMSSKHLLSLINDVLDMSRVESGTVKIEVAPVCIDTVKDNLYSIMNGSAEEKNIHLTTQISSSVTHHWFYADRLHMMRVLTNIVSNSVKYTNPGGRIEVLVEERPCEKEGFTRFRYTVTDTGIGMSEEFLSHVFEPFSRAESATKSGIAGTGLGMSITKSLVELMGGTITINSKVGAGTNVTVEFENRIAEPVDPGEAIPEQAYIDLRGRKILLVEDNILNREIATEILEEEGIVIDTAEDGDIAVEIMRTAEPGQYDVILMDIQMPHMNGYDATRAIRALPDKAAAQIPIIAMTANAFAEDKQNAYAAGMNGHIAKPIDVPKLLKTLSEILQ